MDNQIEKLQKLASKPNKKAPKNWKEKRERETGASLSPDEFMYLGEPTKFADWYPKEAILQFDAAARAHNLSPFDFLGLGIAESGLGYKHPDNPTRINLGVHQKEMERLYPGVSFEEQDSEPGQSEKRRDTNIYHGAKLLAESLSHYPEDRLSGIQAYSGTGRTPYGGGAGKKYFGQSIKKLNLWRDKPQAKRVVEISDALKSIPELVRLLAGRETPPAESVMGLWSK